MNAHIHFEPLLYLYIHPYSLKSFGRPCEEEEQSAKLPYCSHVYEVLANSGFIFLISAYEDR